MTTLADPGSVDGTGGVIGTRRCALAYLESSPQSFLLVCQDVFVVGLADEMLRDQILQLCSIILLSGERWREQRRPPSLQVPEHCNHFDRRAPADAGYLCVPPTLRILKEVVSSYVPEEENGDGENPEGPTAVILGVVANLFQKVIELLARRLRRQPEEGKQVFDGFLNCPQT